TAPERATAGSSATRSERRTNTFRVLLDGVGRGRTEASAACGSGPGRSRLPPRCGPYGRPDRLRSPASAVDRTGNHTGDRSRSSHGTDTFTPLLDVVAELTERCDRCGAAAKLTVAMA